MTRRPQGFVLIPAEGAPPCEACGAARVAVYRDGLEDLMDNMGCELGLELVAGPFCPGCEKEKLAPYAPASRRE